MRNVAVIGLVFTLLLSFTACDDGTTPLPPPGNTPAQVLRSLIYAFNNRDIGTLGGTLADDFTFHFDPNDVGIDIEGYTIPDSWPLENFSAASGNMFEIAYSIDLDIAYESIGERGDGATEFTAEDVQIYLLVMVDSLNGYAPHGYCDFRLVNESADGTDGWVISDWWDKTATGDTYESGGYASLGFVLAFFYEKTGK